VRKNSSLSLAAASYQPDSGYLKPEHAASEMRMGGWMHEGLKDFWFQVTSGADTVLPQMELEDGRWQCD
jgi:hypothetical protein